MLSTPEISLENLPSILPTGVTSKNVIGSRKVFSSKQLCILVAAAKVAIAYITLEPIIVNAAKNKIFHLCVRMYLLHF